MVKAFFRHEVDDASLLPPVYDHVVPVEEIVSLLFAQACNCCFRLVVFAVLELKTNLGVTLRVV